MNKPRGDSFSPLSLCSAVFHSFFFVFFKRVIGQVTNGVIDTYCIPRAWLWNVPSTRPGSLAYTNLPRQTLVIFHLVVMEVKQGASAGQTYTRAVWPPVDTALGYLLLFDHTLQHHDVWPNTFSFFPASLSLSLFFPFFCSPFFLSSSMPLSRFCLSFCFNVYGCDSSAFKSGTVYTKKCGFPLWVYSSITSSWWRRQQVLRVNYTAQTLEEEKDKSITGSLKKNLKNKVYKWRCT